MTIFKLTSIFFVAVSGLWQSTAHAQALVGRLTSAGIEQTDRNAYVVATIDRTVPCNECPRADQVFAAPLDSPFGQRLALMVEVALHQRQLITIVLSGCDEDFYGRRRIISFMVNQPDQQHSLFGGR